MQAIIDRVAPLTEGLSGADLRQICDEAKRAAMKRVRYERLERPVQDDFLVAFEQVSTAPSRRARLRRGP